jgi:hypothetical protein
MAWGGGAGQIPGESAVRGGNEEVLGRHDDVVNSIREQRGGVAHRGGCSTAVGRRGSVRRGWPTVAGDWLLGREGVRAMLGVVQTWPKEDRCGLAPRRLLAAAAQLR